MANRALIAKADRARRQAVEAGRAEYSKPMYIGSKAEARAISEMCDALLRDPDRRRVAIATGMLKTGDAPVYRAERKRAGYSKGEVLVVNGGTHANFRMKQVATWDVYAKPGTSRLISR